MRIASVVLCFRLRRLGFLLTLLSVTSSTGRDKRTVLDLIGERSGSDDHEIAVLLVSFASKVDPKLAPSY